MELLTCPACGCSVQVTDGLIGQRVRCFACRHSFIAEVRPPSPPPLRHDAPPLARRIGPPPSQDEDLAAEERGPFCPGCGRRISWNDPACPYCGEELEAEDGPQSAWQRAADRFRRDYEPHRGRLILTLGNIGMFIGGLSLCTFGLGALVSVPIGILAWLMASHDLERMREGRMDPRGKAQTETGRTGAAAGVILGAIFAAFYALVFLAR